MIVYSTCALFLLEVCVIFACAHFLWLHRGQVGFQLKASAIIWCIWNLFFWCMDRASVSHPVRPQSAARLLKHSTYNSSLNTTACVFSLLSLSIPPLSPLPLSPWQPLLRWQRSRCKVTAGLQTEAWPLHILTVQRKPQPNHLVNTQTCSF